MLLLLNRISRRPTPFAMSDENVLALRVMPTDLDRYGHMTNSRYLRVMDRGRADFIGRTGGRRKLMAKRWTFPVGSAHVDYHREFRLFERYELRTKLESWDNHWFYFRQSFYHKNDGALAAVGYAKVAVKGRSGLASPAEVLGELLGYAPAVPVLSATLRDRFGIKEKEHSMSPAPAPQREPIAIVGIGCRLPGGGNDPQSVWRLLCDGTDCTSDIPESRWSSKKYFDPTGKSPGRTQVNRGGVLNVDLKKFDASFFGMTPHEAEVLDPQQRLLLETSWEAFEDAGIVPSSLARSRTGVYAGGFTIDNAILRTNTGNVDLLSSHTSTSSTLTMLSNRLSYVYDLAGPSITIDTACSSSLVATHYACRGLWAGETEVAIVAGVNALVSPETQVLMSKGKFLAPDGHCKSFSASANGYARGEGAVCLVLKKLSSAIADGNPIYATIVGTAVNQDGRTNGITLPNADAQIAVMREAYADAGVDPQDVVYVEAHGTGTPAGDPIEAGSVGTVVGRRRRTTAPCLLGSIKSNIGHLEAASGVAGILKAALTLRHGSVPPNCNFDQVNPAIALDELGLKVPTTVVPLPPGSPHRYVGVNGFGYGGTNAHIVLAEAPVQAATEETPSFSARVPVVPLAAKSIEALRELAGQYAAVLQTGEVNVATLARSAAVHRDHHRVRAAWVGTQADSASQALGAFTKADTNLVVGPGSTTQKLLFVYTGMGPQWWAMGRELYANEPVFRATVQECDRAFMHVAHFSIASEMLCDESSSRMNRTDIAQPANTVLQIALTRLLASWGVLPAATLGHSIGEVAAAYAAGTITLEEAMLVAAHRSRLQQTLAGRGKMAAVEMTVAEAAQWEMRLGVSCAAVNASTSITLSGDVAALEEIIAQQQKEGRFARMLAVEVPYHSQVMDSIELDLKAAFAPLCPKAPAIPIYSTVSGRLLGSDLHNAEYFWHNARGSVLFAEAFNAALDDGYTCVLEVGPHPVLAASMQAIARGRSLPVTTCSTLVRKSSEAATLATALANLYVNGVNIGWSSYCGPGTYQPIPKYPLQRKQFWLESARSARARYEQLDHPLVSHCEPVPAPHWVADINLGLAAYLLDHIALGSAIFPAAGLIELVLAARRAEHGTAACSIEHLELLAPVALDATARLRLTLAPVAGSPALQIAGCVGEEPAVVCATCDVFNCGVAGEQLDLTLFDQTMGYEKSPHEFYQSLAAIGLAYGPAFRAVEQVRIAPRGAQREMVARVRVPDAAWDPRYAVHPILLDAAFHSLIALSGDELAGCQVVPVSIERIHVLKEAGQSALVHGVLSSVDENNLVGDITLVDENGVTLVRVTGLTCRVLRPSLNGSANLGRLTYQRSFKAFDASAARLTADTTAARCLVIGGTLSDATLTADDSVQLKQELSRGRACIIDLALLDAQHEAADPVASGTRLAERLREIAVAIDVDAVERYVLVSYRAEAVLPQEIPVLACASALGVARTIMTERPDLRMTTLDLDQLPTTLGELVELIANIGDEQEIAQRDGKLFTVRLERTELKVEPRFTDVAEAFELVSPQQGNLDALAFVAAARREPGPFEIEIAMAAVPVNFKDVAKTLGLVSARTMAATQVGNTIGMEGSGTVMRVGDRVTKLRPGDRVYALGPNFFRSHVTISADAAVQIPPTMTNEQAAGAIVFLTVVHALEKVAHLKRGERILIHSATGGVGLAATMVARNIGAEIYATAGSDAKRDYLRSIGIQHVFGSRDVAFADEILTQTKGQGVDVVLSFATGEVFYKSLSCLAPSGRFIEVGKATFDQDLTLKLKPFTDNLTYAAIDMDRLTKSHPAYISTLLHEIFQKFATGEYQPLPTTVFPAKCVTEAFRTMAHGRHIGRVVVALSEQQVPVRAARIHAGATYLVTGGLSGFGLACAEWLVKEGARHLVLVSRRGPQAVEAHQVIAGLRKNGADVQMMAADMAKEEDVQRVLDHVRTNLPPLRGILHAAMVLDDKTLPAMDLASFERVMAPKALGAWHLHRLTSADKLDYMVFFSSISSLIGNAGQANYVAANAFLDALAQQRTAAGKPTCAIQWGVLGETGVVARDVNLAGHLARLGITPLTKVDALAALGQIIDSDTMVPQVGVFDVDWQRLAARIPAGGGGARFGDLVGAAGQTAVNTDGNAIISKLAPLDEATRQTSINEVLVDIVGRVLRVAPADLPPAQPLRELGIDSILAIEIGAAIEQVFGIRLPVAKIVAGPPLAEIGRSLHSELFAATTQ